MNTLDGSKKINETFELNLFDYSIRILYNNDDIDGYDLLFRNNGTEGVVLIGFDFKYIPADQTLLLKNLLK